MLKYYCYISREKVDNLYMQTLEGNIEQCNISKGAELDISAGTPTNKISVLSLVGADLNFGANGLIQYNKTIKAQYSKKLNTIIKLLEKQDLINTLPEKIQPDCLGNFYYYNGLFHVADSPDLIDNSGYVDGFVNIESSTNPDEYKINLVCSMKYFSDTRADNRYMIHSSNYHFFKGHAKIKFDTLFICTSIDPDSKTIFGSPLFLALDQKRGQQL